MYYIQHSLSRRFLENFWIWNLEISEKDKSREQVSKVSISNVRTTRIFFFFQSSKELIKNK